MIGFLPAALLAVFLSTLAGGAADTPVSATEAQEIISDEAARNRTEARRFVERRLNSIELPPGAETSEGQPSGVGDRLREAVAIPGGNPHVTAHRFWTVPRAPSEVLAWLRRHAPATTKWFGGEIGGTGGRTLEFESLPGPEGALGGLLFITVVQRSAGGSAVRADVFEDWEIPRSPLQRIPAGSRFLRLSVSPGSSGVHRDDENTRPTRAISTEDRGLIAKLVRIVNRQPAYQLVDLASCGGVRLASEEHLITLVFKTTSDGATLAQVSQIAPIGICDALHLQVEGRRPYALERGWDVLRAARGLIRRAH